jgi:[acyl-carrier-protein] S-malonyltransferase
MGKALYDSSKRAKAIFDRADEALGWKLSTLCFEGPDTDLMLTANTQPAILTTSIAFLEALREELGSALPAPALVAGHSLGEYTALVAAEAISLEDAVRLVNLRGRAMQEAVPAGLGAMAAIIGGTIEQIQSICDECREGEALSPANFNSPGQVVIAGHATAVERAKAKANEAELNVIPLKVSAPFHCALMRPAADAVKAALETIKLSTPLFPIVANVDAKPNQEAREIPSLLVRQVDGTVQWEQSVKLMADWGVTKALEIGPGTVLAGLVKRTDKRITTLSVNSPVAIAKVSGFLSPAVAQVVATGA